MRFARETSARVRSALTHADGLALAVGVSLIAKLLLARHFVIGHALAFGVLVDACAMAGLVAAASLAPERFRRGLLSALAVALPIGMLVGVMYASYFGELPTLGMVRVSGQLAVVPAATARLFRWPYLLFLIDLPLLLAGPLRARLLPVRSAHAMTSVAAIGLSVAALAAVAAAVMPGALESPTDLGFTAYAAASLVPVSTHASAEGRTLQGRIDALSTRSGSHRRLAGAPAAGSMAGKNLIVVQMESLQTGLIGARIDGKPIVPNLENLAKQSLYFPNAYSQIGRGNTSDAEFVANTSLYPAADQPSSVEYANKVLPGLPRLLDDAGYATMTLHTDNVSFWNRQEMYPALGFDAIYDKSYFGNGQPTGFGASDHVLYSRSVPLLAAAAAEGKPFYAQIVTVSAHYPFDRTGGTPPLQLPPDLANTETGRYLQAQSYADAELGKFVKKLKSAGLLENSVLVVYGDHFGMRFEVTDADNALRRQLLGHDYNASDFYNVPLLIRVPGVAGASQPQVVGQIDIMPTLADLFGIDISGVPHFGRSAFVDTPTLLTRASTVDTCITDDLAYFRGLTEGDGSYSPDTHAPLTATPPAWRIADARQLVALSEDYAKGLPDRANAGSELGHIPKSASDPENTPYR